MKSPLVSIIIPIYNVELYLEQCLLSVFDQTYSNIEVIIVDDCGTDNSVIIAERFLEQHREVRAKIVHHDRNRGLSAARNTGVKVAEGEYVCFVDSDDEIDSSLCQSLVDGSEDGKYGIVSCLPMYGVPGHYEVFRKDDWQLTEPKVIIPSDFAEQFLLQKTCHAVWGKIMKRSLFDSVIFREGKLNEDTLFFFDLIPIIIKENILTKVLPLYLYFYRKNENGICLGVKKTPFFITELENQKEVILGLKQLNMELSNILLFNYIKMIIKQYIYYINREECQTDIVNKLSNLLEGMNYYSVSNKLTKEDKRDFNGIKYFPYMYRDWYLRYVLHIKPTLIENIRIMGGSIKKKIFNR